MCCCVSGQQNDARVPVKGVAGADPDAESAVAAHGGVLIHANDLEMGAAGTSTGNIVRYVHCMAVVARWKVVSPVPLLLSTARLKSRVPNGR